MVVVVMVLKMMKVLQMVMVLKVVTKARMAGNIAHHNAVKPSDGVLGLGAAVAHENGGLWAVEVVIVWWVGDGVLAAMMGDIGIFGDTKYVITNVL